MPLLTWNGKEKVLNHHLDVPYHTLKAEYTYPKNAVPDGNLIIHGDNLLALKALLPQYEGRVKLIYIDPPYNTGNENWVYNDNVNDPKIKKWIGEVVGKEGEDFSRHDKWLCMMYPRLKLLHKLLREDGAIFISIDDNEQANLKLICDEIFGKYNFIADFIWYTEGHTDNQDVITGVHEYILCYGNKKEKLEIQNVVDPNVSADSKIRRDFAENSITKNGIKNPPSIITLPVGFPCECATLNLSKSHEIERFINEVEQKKYISRELTQKYSMVYPARLDELVVKDGKLIKECRVFTGWMNANKLQDFIKNNCEPLNDKETQLRFYLSKNGVIYYYRGNRVSHYIQTILEKMGTTETNKYMLEDMGIIFEFPKPVELVSFLIKMYSNQDSIILDSFAGSGTTAHAVLNLNKQDGGNCKFILVEMEDYAETITAERIRRVIDGYGEGDKKVAGTGGSFSYCKLGEAVFNADGSLNSEVSEADLRQYVWYAETKSPLQKIKKSADNPYYLGTFLNVAYYFYFDKKKPTTLGYAFLRTVKTKAEQYCLYADSCSLSSEYLESRNIRFKKIPRDIPRY